jgi:hypothetical protein
VALTNYYVSIPQRRLVPDVNTKSNLHSGTSATTTDFIELRMMINDGANPTGLTRLDVIAALEDVFTRWILEGGLAGDGVNVPAG